MRPKIPDMIYEDDAVLVCRKEAGIPVQTARSGCADMVSILRNYRAAKGEEPYIGLVHRLDQPVEGVMVFAKTKAAAASLSGQVSGGSMGKEYLAVVCKKPAERAGRLTDWLLRDGRTNTSAVVQAGTPGAKEARLSYEVCRTDEASGRTLVRVFLHTGRHHQIRVQFAHAGMPLYGDVKYGEPLPAGVRMPVALCSCRISFAHPVTKKKMEFEIAPSGPGFADFLPEPPRGLRQRDT